MSADLVAAREAVAAAEADVEAARARLRDVIRDQESRGVSADGPDDGKPVQQTAEDALAWIRRKHGQTRSERAAANGTPPDRKTEADEAQERGTSSATGRAEAQRRAVDRGR